MIYVKNLPLWERALRIGFGMGAAAYGIISLDGLTAWAIASGGVGAALTGIFGFCPACAMAGRRLRQAAQQRQTAK